ncbi:MAG TPA: acyl-CoA dehydrogenase family protein [Streptosporangiaceae bacterium]|nr:acyl-CoA dehydrogenase family protein [Streptosporangiaceae bacterium]
MAMPDRDRPGSAAGEIPEGPEGRDGFLDALRAHRATFEAAARRAEEARTLPADVVALLRDLHLFWMKTPRELGGSELDPLEFCDVLEELAYYDASAAWTVMVGNGTTGVVAGWVAGDRLGEVFPAEPTAADLPICAGQFVARGTAVPVDGGYQVTGRWSFCSGIEHADWLVGGCRVAGSRPGAGHAAETGDGRGGGLGQGSGQILVVVPKAQASRHDTWYAAGLQGTGSGDFSLADVFVPAGRAFDWFAMPPVRGGDLFRQARVLFVSNELSPVVVGIARRAIDDMYALASATDRRLSRVYLSERAAFQKEISRAECRLRAMRLLYRDTVAECWAAARTGREPDASFVPRQLAQHTLVVEECTDLVDQIMRYAGGRALALEHPMQRHLRNLIAARQHVYVSDENYEQAAKAKLAEYT